MEGDSRLRENINYSVSLRTDFEEIIAGGRVRGRWKFLLRKPKVYKVKPNIISRLGE